MLFRNRSVAQLLLFEKQKDEYIANAPILFDNINRSDHPTDVLFCPQFIIDKEEGIVTAQ
jgi:hypothetical protein